MSDHTRQVKSPGKVKTWTRWRPAERILVTVSLITLGLTVWTWTEATSGGHAVARFLWGWITDR